MRHTPITIALPLLIVLSLPLPALAFWGGGGEDHPALNLKSGYDVNTVTTVKGRLISILTGVDRPNVQLELDSSGVSIVVCTGPRHYWAEKGIPLDPGDEIMVRGSKAQGNDGIIYVIAQKVTNTTQAVSVVLRDETGRPVWAGQGIGRGQGRTTTRERPAGQRPTLPPP